MRCRRCASESEEGARFCRTCGTAHEQPRDPDELVGSGISKVITGDGFLMVALFLSVTHTAMSSMLWLLLLIPAFYLFGQGFADVFQARQIRRRGKNAEIAEAKRMAELPPSQVSVVDILTRPTTRELAVKPPSMRGRGDV